MVVQCCVCKRVQKGTKWILPSASDLDGNVSHGYYPRCANQAFAEIQAHNAAMEAARAEQQ